MKSNSASVFPPRATESAEGKKSCVFKFLFFDPPATAQDGENESKSTSSKKTKKKKTKKPTTSVDTAGQTTSDACLQLETVNGIDEIPAISQISMEQMCSVLVEVDDTTVTTLTKKNNNKPKNKKDSSGTKKARASVADDDEEEDIDAMVKALDAKAALVTKQTVVTSSSSSSSSFHKTTTSNNTKEGRTGVPKKKSDVNVSSPATFSFKSQKDPELTNEQKELMIRHRQRAIAGPRRTSATATNPTTSTACAPTSEPESSNPFSFGFSVA